MKRAYGYITVGRILEELKKDGVSIGRATFYNLETDGVFQSSRSARDWRVYTPDEAAIIIHLIKENYGVKTKTDKVQL